MVKKMLNDNILLKIVRKEKKTDSGIILKSDTLQYKVGVIKATSDEELFPVGEECYIPVYAGVALELDGEDYIIVKKNEIIMLV